MESGGIAASGGARMSHPQHPRPGGPYAQPPGYSPHAGGGPAGAQQPPALHGPPAGMGTDARTVELSPIGGRRVAGMGRRLLARVLDGLVVGVPAELAGALVIAGLSAGEVPHVEAQQAAGVPNPQPSTGYVISVMAVLAVLAIGAVLYEIAMIAGL